MTDYPCHQLPRNRWCDRDGPGGFMGHTCLTTTESIMSRQLFNNREHRGDNLVNLPFADLYHIIQNKIDPLGEYDGAIHALCQQICVAVEQKMGTFPSPYRIRPVMQNWVNGLPLRQQGVIVLALRGPDGVPKEHPAKVLVRTLRGMTMNAGRTGEPMKRGVFWRDDPFMTIAFIEDMQQWVTSLRSFFDHFDEFNIHFLQHIMHAFAVCGMHYPDETIRDRAWGFYVHCCDKLHVIAESPEAITWRLRDGEREEDKL